MHTRRSAGTIAIVAVYLFTFHAYRSWLPDRPQGYVRRGKGIQGPDTKMAELYKRDAKHPAMRFDAQMQDILVTTTRSICAKKQLAFAPGTRDADTCARPRELA